MTKNYINKIIRALGPAITKGFLKLRFICLLRTWKTLDGFVGATNEKFAY